MTDGQHGAPHGYPSSFHSGRSRRGSIPDQRHRLHRVLRRQRQAGEPLLPRGVRLSAGRLPRPGDRRPRPRELPAGQQDKVRFVLTSPLGPDGPIADAPSPARRRGTRPRALGGRLPRGLRQGHGPRGRRGAGADGSDGRATARWSSPAIRTYGDTIHTLVERRNYRGLFLPGFRPVDVPLPAGAGRAAATSTTASATSSWAR